MYRNIKSWADVTFWLILVTLLVVAGIVSNTMLYKGTSAAMEQRAQQIMSRAMRDLDAKRVEQAERGFQQAIDLTKYKTIAYITAIEANLNASKKIGLRAKDHAAAFATQLLDLNERGKLDRKLEPKALFNLGISLDDIGRRSEAIKALEQAVAIDTHNPIYMNALGYTYADTNQHLDRALELTKCAVSISPNEPSFIDSLGWTYFKLGRYRDAVRELQRAVKGIPNHPDLRYHLAAAYERVGKMTEASMELQKALALDPNNVEALALLHQMRRNKKL
jgi:tetratricopeptide (TPR) repeat protein